MNYDLKNLLEKNLLDKVKGAFASSSERRDAAFAKNAQAFKDFLYSQEDKAKNATKKDFTKVIVPSKILGDEPFIVTDPIASRGKDKVFKDFADDMTKKYFVQVGIQRKRPNYELSFMKMDDI